MTPTSLPPPDAVQVAADCQKKLQNGSLPQLETRLQCLPVHVRDANGTDPLSLTIKGDLQIRGAVRCLYYRYISFVSIVSDECLVTRSPLWI